jgi:universal stress protein E
MSASESAVSRAFETFYRARALFRSGQRRILCATDLSLRSAPALEAAVVLANRVGAKLTRLHVSPGRAGDMAKTIAQAAFESGAQLIVMGAQRKRPLAPILGTTAERVVALAQRPVLIVRSRGTLRYERVVVAAELKPSFEDMVRFADRWFFLDAPSLSIVHGFASPYRGPLYAEGYDLVAARRQIAEWKGFARRHLLDMLDAAGVEGSRFEIRIEERRPFRLVRHALRHRTASLLILGTSAHNAFTRIVRGSLLNDALLSLECDVLICPPTAGARTLQ